MSTEERERLKRTLAMAALLLLLERKAKAALGAALSLPLLHLPRLGATPSHVQNGIRVAGRKAIATIRSDARGAGLDRWVKQTGIFVRPEQTVIAHVDRARAEKSADSLAAQWGKSRQVALADGATEHEATAHATDVLDSAADRTAVTEAADALNDEIARANEEARRGGYIVVETWSSILDSRTCPECDALNGRQKRSPERFDPPPIHSRCRCLIDTEILPIAEVA